MSCGGIKMRHLKNDKLSARERIDKTLNFEEPDRVPINEFVQNFELVEYLTGERVTFDNYFDLLCKVLSENVDVCETVAPPLQPRIRKEPDGFIYKDEWWTSWVIERPFKDLKGLKEHIKREIEDLQEYHTGEEMTYAGKTNLWWGDSIKQEHPKESFKQTLSKLDNVVVFMAQSPVGLDVAYNRAGFELFSYACYEYPELIHDWLEAIYNFEIKRIHDIADKELSPLVLVYCDIAMNNGLIFSPDWLRKILIPYLKKNVEAWHSHGIKCIYHSEGDIRKFIPDLIDAGVDGIHPVEPMAGVSTKEIKEKYPNLIMVGGLDNSNMLTSGSFEEIEKNVKDAIDGGAKSGGYIISCGEVHPACERKRVLKMWESEIKYGYY